MHQKKQIVINYSGNKEGTEESTQGKKVSEKINNVTEMDGNVAEKDNVDDTEMKEDFVMKNPILDHFTISKNMPRYRKIDIMAFILFSGFYICFNFVYFVICIHH